MGFSPNQFARAPLFSIPKPLFFNLTVGKKMASSHGLALKVIGASPLTNWTHWLGHLLQLKCFGSPSVSISALLCSHACSASTSRQQLTSEQEGLPGIWAGGRGASSYLSLWVAPSLPFTCAPGRSAQGKQGGRALSLETQAPYKQQTNPPTQKQQAPTTTTCKTLVGTELVGSSRKRDRLLPVQRQSKRPCFGMELVGSLRKRGRLLQFGGFRGPGPESEQSTLFCPERMAEGFSAEVAVVKERWSLAMVPGRCRSETKANVFAMELDG